MITGDNKETAENIAMQTNILEEKDNSKVFDGSEFEEYPIEEKKKKLEKLLERPCGFVFARTEPKNKKSLVELLKEVQVHNKNNNSIRWGE